MKVGLGSEGIDFSELERQIAYCAYCPKMCRFSCPTALVRPSEAIHPTGKATILWRLLKQAAPVSRDVADVLYRCTGCMLSRSFCDHEIQVYPPIEKARALAFVSGVSPNGVQEAIGSVRTWGNPFGGSLAYAFYQQVPHRWVQPEAQILVFAGCATLEADPSVLADLVAVLEILRMDTVGFLPPDPTCCGGICLDLGDQEGFRKAAAALVPRLASAKRILTLCPHCHYTLKTRYGWLDPSLANRVEHLAQFLWRFSDRMQPIDGAAPEEVLYHDPCYLGRYMGVFQPPRDLLRKILLRGNLQEFPQRAHKAGCCGGGGGLPFSFPEEAEAIASRRLASAPCPSSTVVVSACPWCTKMLRAARPQGGVMDLVSALARSLCP
ncbi:MAG: (Fe-S)-binding protein [Thermodesulfobacteriota bacterium]